MEIGQVSEVQERFTIGDPLPHGVYKEHMHSINNSPTNSFILPAQTLNFNFRQLFVECLRYAMCWPQCSDTTLCNFILNPIQTVCFDLIFNLHGLKWVWPVLHMHSWCPIGAHEPLKVVREHSTWNVECAILGTFLDIMLWTMAWAAWYITNILPILEIWVALFHF